MEEFISKIRRKRIQKLAVIFYGINEFGEVVMLKRNKEPFKDKLVPPGGKLEKGESVVDALKREFYEETGIEINNYVLKVITTEIGPDGYNWILFIYKGYIKKKHLPECDEGKLYWIKKEELRKQDLSEIDKKLLPYIFEERGLFLFKIDYDNDKNYKIVNIKKLSSFFQ
ncbi:MAG: NUDIX domain-containing protein [Thermosipho sp. (in: Bacteria)]|nr:NUDIX domain-containing protein [Thermosipho sp. (in: thermotogales)]